MQVTLANWRTAPFSRWAFHHVRELVPSADIPHDPEKVRALPRGAANLPADLEEFLRETDTDGMAIAHRGRLVLERYGNGMTEQTPHILMSVSKSMLGLLIHELGLDTGRRVVDVIPEVRDTAYRDASLRHLLDMRAGIAWEEDYLATGGPIVEYRKATGWNPLGVGEAPSDLKSFFKTLTQRKRAEGGPLHYTSPNSDLLGWVVERMTGGRYADLMSERVWKPAGAERGAYITVDRFGAPRCAGGMCTTLRDLVRVGLWLIEKDEFWSALKDGDVAAWSNGDLAQYFPPGLPIHYRSHWYILNGAAPLVFGLGIHGQNLFIDRANEIVIVKFSSQAPPLDAALIGRTMNTVAALRKLLA